jgi:hypothetical protein
MKTPLSIVGLQRFVVATSVAHRLAVCNLLQGSRQNLITIYQLFQLCHIKWQGGKNSCSLAFPFGQYSQPCNPYFPFESLEFFIPGNHFRIHPPCQRSRKAVCIRDISRRLEKRRLTGGLTRRN